MDFFLSFITGWFYRVRMCILMYIYNGNFSKMFSMLSLGLCTRCILLS